MFAYSEKTIMYMEKLGKFMDDFVYPNETKYQEQVAEGDRFAEVPLMEELKQEARRQGLWNLFLPDSDLGQGLSNLEYAPLAEIMGRVVWAPEVFNCNAPDTGNMEVLVRYGTVAQKERWLQPLLDGKIRSCFSMTEPDVASSDATNIDARAELKGDYWVINGRKWFSSGAGDPRCKVSILMVKTNPDNDRHTQHSQIIVPLDTEGVRFGRPIEIFGYDDAPHGHPEIIFDDVKVPKDHVILGAGRGFEIAQGRLGPGRIHHCMRCIGQAERALELMVKRSLERQAFGKPLAKLGGNIDVIANSRIEIDQARLLVLKAAHMMDTVGNKDAKSEIAAIKVVATNVACNVIDRAIQVFGAAGVSQYTPLAAMYSNARTLRLADGPDEVHRMIVGRQEMKKHLNR